MYHFVLIAGAVWTVIGLPLALYLVGPGWSRLRADASGPLQASPAFRLAVIPAAVLLWPVLLRALLRGSPER